MYSGKGELLLLLLMMMMHVWLLQANDQGVISCPLEGLPMTDCPCES